jgi:hypothetical protein
VVQQRELSAYSVARLFSTVFHKIVFSEMTMSEQDLDRRVQAVERLTALYKPERTVHLIATSTSLLVLLGTAAAMLYQRKAGPAELTLMFGSSGLITYTAGQLLRMWDKAISVIVSEPTGSKK